MGTQEQAVLSAPTRLGLAMGLAIVALGTLLALVARANPAPGDLDPTFGAGGVVTTAIGSSSDWAHAVAIQPDGKIVVVGHTDIGGSGRDFALARYEVSGTLDASFGMGGIVNTSIGSSYDSARAVAIQSDGKIIVAGSTRRGSHNDFALARYNSNGTLDASFGSGGVVITSISNDHDSARGVVIQPDGKIVVAGVSHIGGSSFALARYNSDGTLDTSFGVGGMTTTSISSGYDSGHAVAIQPDGKIVVAGDSPNGSGDGFAVVRYEVSGTLDTSFGTGGVVTTSIGAYSCAYAVAIHYDGKVVVAGESATDYGPYHFALVRYSSGGTLDPSFGAGGVVTTPVTSSGEWCFGVALQADGKTVAVGSSGDISPTVSVFAVARYDALGTLDASFGANGTVTTSIGDGTDWGHDVVLQNDGKIVVAGSSHNGSDHDFAVVRYDTRVIGSASVCSETTAVGETNVRARFADGDLCCTVAVTKTIAFPGGVYDRDPGEMPMTWELSTDCASPYSTTLSFCYTDEELAQGDSVSETLLKALKHTGGGMWTNMGGIVDLNANCVTVSGITSLSEWTVGDPSLVQHPYMFLPLAMKGFASQ